jgi:hypothetical protein
MLHLELNDREVERVLSGQQPYGRPDLAETAFFFAQLKAMAGFERPPRMSPALRSQLDAVPAPDNTAEQEEIPNLSRVRARREAARARRRWRVVGAAAMVLTLGGAVLAGLQEASSQGRSADAETEDQPTTSAEPETTDAAPQVKEAPTPTPETEPDPEPTPPPTAEAPEPEPVPEEAQPAPPIDIEPQEEAPEILHEPPSWWLEWPEECPTYDWDCWWDWYSQQRREGDRGRSDGDPSGRP